ncbi:MAG TPA: hypothetical protein DEA43_00495 [Candidatus Moranbacteria bacterium]|nr:hypothetical protein [Candidatus Moranbacteria bacterium]HBT45351.1 hypothetical protein [Candidatus Moranbacteria bacterium]
MFTAFLVISFGFMWVLTFPFYTNNGWVIFVGLIGSLLAGWLLGNYLKKHSDLDDNNYSTKSHYVVSVTFVLIGTVVSVLLIALVCYLIINYYPFQEMDALIGMFILPFVFLGLFGSGALFLSGLKGIEKFRKEEIASNTK